MGLLPFVSLLHKSSLKSHQYSSADSVSMRLGEGFHMCDSARLVHDCDFLYNRTSGKKGLRPRARQRTQSEFTSSAGRSCYIQTDTFQAPALGMPAVHVGEPGCPDAVWRMQRSQAFRQHQR